MRLALLFTVLIKLAVCQNVHNCSDVEVDKSESDDTQQHYFCANNLPNDYRNNTNITICSTEKIVLEKVIHIEGISNISIFGCNDTIITCQNNMQAGLSFKNIKNLVISNIIIQNCANEAKFDNKLNHNIDASISIQNCANVDISNIRVMNGSGTGLALFDTEGTLNILDSTFEGNGYARSKGGNGVYLEVSDKANLISPSVTYNFIRCKFLHNIAHTGKDKTISGFSMQV